jgi:hypothetical protein
MVGAFRLWEAREMRLSGFVRCALTALTQQSWIARDAARLKGPLLYVSDGGDNFLYVFSLPGGKLVEKITGYLSHLGFSES